MIFKREPLTEDLLDEMLPLLQAHYEEIARFKDIPLNPDWDFYRAVDTAGMLRIFTMRRPTGHLLGYAVYFVRTNPHYKTSLQATQDILFVHPDWRGHGLKFLLWCDEQLKGEEVQIVCQHIKSDHNFGAALERAGYQLLDLIYARRLDKEG